MFSTSSTLWILVFIAAFLLSGTRSLKSVKVAIPQVAKIHDSVSFQCIYDLEGEPLYTVKWYKGQMEFFRYIPKEDPSMQIFSVPGVHVDLSRSSPNEVVLLEVEPEATGRYKCEVSTDAPNFYTQTVSGYMYVIDVPDETPILEISKDNFGSNYTIQANCTTPPSYPAMNVTWYINGIKVNESGRRSVSLDPVLVYSKNRRAPYMTVSHIQKEIDDNIFQVNQGGVIKVQCISTLFNVYKSENVRYIEDNRLQPWPSSVIGVTKNTAGSSISSYWAYVVQCVAAFWILMISR